MRNVDGDGREVIEKCPVCGIAAAGIQRETPAAFQHLLDFVVEQVASRVAGDVANQLTCVKGDTEPWRLLDVEEAAARLGRSSRWLRDRVKLGQVPFVRLDGGALAFELEDVQAFARARRIAADEPTALAGRLQGSRDPRSRAALEVRERATDPEVEA